MIAPENMPGHKQFELPVRAPRQGFMAHTGFTRGTWPTSWHVHGFIGTPTPVIRSWVLSFADGA